MSDTISDTDSDPRHARHAVAAAISVGVAFIAVVAGIAAFAGVGLDGFRSGSIDQLTQAFRNHGLTLCAASNTPDPGYAKGGSISTEVFGVALPGDCAHAIDVQVDTYKTAGDRDAAARNAEMQERQRNYGVVYTWHQFTVYLQADDASGSTDIRNRVVDALEAVGAN